MVNNLEGFKPYLVQKGGSPERRNEFYRRNDRDYQDALVEVFRQTIRELKGTELGRPVRILQEMATFSADVHSELEQRFTNMLDNVRRGKSKGIGDPEFFELMESFVWKHRPENIRGLRAGSLVKHLGNAISVFISPNEYDRALAIRYESDIEYIPERPLESGVPPLEEGVVYRAAYLTSFDQEPVKWSELSGRFKLKTTQSQEEIDNSYFAIKKLKGNPYDFVISFNEATGNQIHYGVHLPQRNLILLKSFRTNFPVYVDYSLSTKNSYSKDTSRHPRSHTIIKNYFEPLGECDVDPSYSNPKEVAYAKQRANEIFTNFGF